MPKIPLADIPNAPALGPMPALVQTPNFRVNTASLAPNLMQAPVDPTPYVAAAGSGAVIGKAVTEGISRAIEPWITYQQKLADSKDAGDIARSNTLMYELSQEHEIATAGQPEDQRLKSWQESFRPRFEKFLTEAKVSARAAARIIPEWVDFDGRRSVDIRYKAAESRREDDKQAILNNINFNIEQGNEEAVATQIDNLVRAGHATKNAADKMKLDARGKLQHQQASLKLLRDPFTFQQQLQSMEKGETVEDLTWMQPADILRYTENAATRIRNLQNSASQQIENEILLGHISGERQIREIAEQAHMPEEEIKSHIDSLVVKSPKTDKELEKQKEIELDLWTRIDRYDPSLDVKQEQDRAFRREIRAKMPEGQREGFVRLLDERRDSGISDVALTRAAVNKQLENLVQRGLLAGKIASEKNMAPGARQISSSAPTRLEVVTTQIRLQKQFRRWQQDNPQKATDADAISKWLYDNVGKSAIEQAAQSFQKRPNQFRQDSRTAISQPRPQAETPPESPDLTLPVSDIPK